MDLSKAAPKAVLHNWALAQVRGRSHEVPGAIGRAVVHGSGGQTTAVVAVDSTVHRVLTETGSVYALGVPNLGFAATHPRVMRELGY